MALATTAPSTVANDGIRASITSLTNNAYLGQISGTTTTTQTGGWLDMTGWNAFTLEVVQATFMGSYRVEVSNDDSSTKTRVYRLDQNNNPTVAQSNSYIITNNEGYKFLRVIGAPTASNAGTADFFIRRMDPRVGRSMQADYADWMGNQQILLASANRTTNIAKTDFRIKGCAFTMFVNITANAGAHGVFSIYKKDLQTGIYTATVLDSADKTTTGLSIFTVSPYMATSANLIAQQLGSEWAIDTQGVTDMTYSVTIQPIAF